MAIKLERLVKTYYDALEEGKILGRKCPVCGNVEWPPVYACNACGSYETEWYEMSGRGVMLELYMPTPLSSKPAYKDLEPYAYGWVKTEEGPERNVMVLNVTRENEAWIRAHMPYPVHMEIVQRDGYKTCIFAIDPVNADGTPAPPIKRAASVVFSGQEDAGTETKAAPAAAASSETLKSLIRLVAETYNVDASTLSAETRFQEDLKAPSVVFVGLVAKLEDEFDVMVNLTDAAAAKTIGGLAALIDNMMGK